MSGGFVLAWIGPDGSRHANPIARDMELVEALAGARNRSEWKSGRYMSISVENLEIWKEQATMDVTTETWADAQAMMINGDGDPVPANLIPGRIKLEDQTVRILVEKALAMQSAMAAFKTEAFSDVHTFMAEMSAGYGVTLGGRRGGVRLDSYDGLKKVEISVADSLTFGPELNAAKDLIDACIVSWSADAMPELRVLINDAFRVGGTGKVRVDRVVGLRRLEIKDPRWQMAMVAISDALRKQGSVSYIRFYQRESQDVAWQHIPLDMSRL
jgi:hypothetical protein